MNNTTGADLPSHLPTVVVAAAAVAAAAAPADRSISSAGDAIDDTTASASDTPVVVVEPPQAVANGGFPVADSTGPGPGPASKHSDGATTGAAPACDSGQDASTALPSTSAGSAASTDTLLADSVPVEAGSAGVRSTSVRPGECDDAQLAQGGDHGAGAGGNNSGSSNGRRSSSDVVVGTVDVDAAVDYDASMSSACVEACRGGDGPPVNGGGEVCVASAGHGGPSQASGTPGQSRLDPSSRGASGRPSNSGSSSGSGSSSDSGSTSSGSDSGSVSGSGHSSDGSDDSDSDSDVDNDGLPSAKPGGHAASGRAGASASSDDLQSPQRLQSLSKV